MKAKVLLGVYNLEAKRSWFRKGANELCPLCKAHIEDREHFLIKCDVLHEVRNQYLEEFALCLKKYLPYPLPIVALEYRIHQPNRIHNQTACVCPRSRPFYNSQRSTSEECHNPPPCSCKPSSENRAAPHTGGKTHLRLIRVRLIAQDQS